MPTAAPRSRPPRTSERPRATGRPAFNDPVDLERLEARLDVHLRRTRPRLRRLWRYYRNPVMSSEIEGRLAQTQGLPDRLRPTKSQPPNSRPRELVVENDIAWRIHALVDFMFGKPASISSLSHDPARAASLDGLLREVFDASGGVAFFQDLALLGSVYGFVDVLVHADATRRTIRLEAVEAPRAAPLVNRTDYRVLDGYALYEPARSTAAVDHAQSDLDLEKAGDGDSTASGWLARAHRLARRLGAEAEPDPRDAERLTLWTPRTVRTFVGRSLRRGAASLSVNRLGELPVVHIQNLAQPYAYAGLSEVEPLIPLQDELNTRLSDRANRIALQSFKMYLGKGLEGFLDRPVGPGQMWSTDNPEATIETFGGDAECPSETRHITEIREAMDKTSGVTAVAAGLIGGRIGNLTSENALRVTLLGLLARTQKKRVTYGRGLEQLCALIFKAADVLGVLPNAPHERRVRIDWPSPLPENEHERLRNALLKRKLGVPSPQLMVELGYRDCVGAAGGDDAPEAAGGADGSTSSLGTAVPGL